MIDWNEARALWADGFDTLEIADEFEVDEEDIYNGLAVGKGHVDLATILSFYLIGSGEVAA